MKKILTACFLICIWIIACNPAQSITWCHDYSLYKATEFATGKQTNFDRTSISKLRNSLKDLGYKRYDFTNAAKNPRAQEKLNRGYIIIFGDDHSGVINKNHLIDHFIQKYGASGTSYLPEQLESLESFKRSWTLKQIINFKRKTSDGRIIFPYRNKSVEVWKKSVDQSATEKADWVLKDGYPKFTPFESSPPEKFLSHRSPAYKFSGTFNYTNAAITETDYFEGQLNYDWIFKFEWDDLPRVIKSDEPANLKFSGTASGSKMESGNRLEKGLGYQLGFSWENFDVKIDGQKPEITGKSFFIGSPSVYEDDTTNINNIAGVITLNIPSNYVQTSSITSSPRFTIAVSSPAAFGELVFEYEKKQK